MALPGSIMLPLAVIASVAICSSEVTLTCSMWQLVVAPLPATCRQVATAAVATLEVFQIVFQTS
jgi:hypothetical protein